MLNCNQIRSRLKKMYPNTTVSKSFDYFKILGYHSSESEKETLKEMGAYKVYNATLTDKSKLIICAFNQL